MRPLAADLFTATFFRIFPLLISPQVPVRLKHYECRKRSQELLVFRPRIGDVLEDFEFNGFIAEEALVN
jgi:hypothetical protein